MGELPGRNVAKTGKGKNWKNQDRGNSEYRTLAFGNKIYRSTSSERQGVLSEF